MAQLNFPENPLNGQLYPSPCPQGVTQYSWDNSTGMWRIVGVATGVIPGQYGNDLTVGQFTVDVSGNITNANNISIRSASVSSPGVVQLNDTTSSVRTDEALTARAGKSLQDQIGNLAVCTVPSHANVVAALNDLQAQSTRQQTDAMAWCGYYNAQEGDISYVSITGARLGYVIGQELPLATASNGGDFFIVNSAGNPYIAGDFNAPDIFMLVGNWVISEAQKWEYVDAQGGPTKAIDVTFQPTLPVTSRNVQGALTQLITLLRTSVGGATISDTKPGNPYPGQLWWDDDYGIFYIFYIDSNSSQWVEVGGGGSQALGGAGGGTVYEIRTGVGLTGGPINTEGTISLVSAGVTNSTIGGVYIPPNKGLSILQDGNLTLTPASRSLLGGIIVGSNLSVTAEGVLSADGGGGSAADVVTIRPISGISTASNVQEALEAIELQAQDRVEFVQVLDLGFEATITLPDLNSNDGTTLQLTPLRAGINDAYGVVSLTNDLTGNSQSLAITQFAGNVLQRQIAALVGVNVLAGTYNAQTGVMVYVTPAGFANGFRVGQNCPSPTISIDNYYVIVTIGGSVSPPTAVIQPAGAGDWYICQAEVGTTPVWFLIDYENITVAAVNVTLATVPGLTATNAQSGIEQVQANALSRTRDITSIVGLSVNYDVDRDVVLNLKVATSTDLGGIYVVSNRGLNLGTDGGLTLDAPSTDGLQIGGVKAGTNITITAEGVISAAGGGGGGTASETVVSPLIPGIEFATNVQRALEAIETQVQDRVEFVTAGTTGLEIVVTNPISTSNDGTTATISLDFSTTGQRGIVQLTNDITGKSEQIAPTQLAISLLNSKVDALVGANVLAGTYNSNTGTVATVTPAGRAAGLIVGQQAPLASGVPDNYYLIVTVAGGSGPPGAIIPPTGVQSGDWFISETEGGVSAWVTIDYENRAVAAVQVSLAPVPGITATNVQTGFEQIQLELDAAINSVASINNGITATTFPTPNSTGESVSIQLNPATKFDIGGVFIADNQGLLLTQSGGLSLAPPTSSVIGGVRAGTNITITAEGVISAAGGGGGGSADVVTITPIPGISTATNVQEALEAIELQVQDRVEFVEVLDLGITATVTAPILTSNDGTTLQITPLRAGIDGAYGVVSLTNDLTGNSETLAVTQFAGNVLQRQISALVGVNILAGTFNAQAGILVYVTPAGFASGFVVGQNCPSPSTDIDNYYVIVTIGGSVPPPTADVTFAGAGDWYICQAEAGTTPVWFLIDYENITVAAANVTLAAVPGLSATNVQTGIEQVQLTALSRTGTIRSTVGLSLVYETDNDLQLNLLVASSTDLGGVYVVPNRGIALGSDGGITLSPPTEDGVQIGGVKAGTNITITAEGVISAAGGGGGGSADVVTIRPIPGISTATNVQEALEAIELQVQDRVEFVEVLDLGITATITAPGLTSNDGTTLQITPLRAGIDGAYGVVSLTNDLTGNSETLAVTQFAGNVLQRQISALVGVNILAGTYNAQTGVMVYVTPAGLINSFVVGQNCPSPSTGIDNYYVIVTVGGSLGPPTAISQPAGAGDWYICQAEVGTTPVWFLIDYENITVAAANVTLAAVPGLSATNVQTGIEQVQLNAESRTKDISSTIGLTVAYLADRNAIINLIAANSTDLGGVYVVPNRGLNLGSDGGLTLNPPSEDGIQIGGVRAGTNITITAEGVISAAGGGGGGSADVVTIRPISGISTATNVQEALEAIELQVQDRVEFVEVLDLGITATVTAPILTSNDGTILKITPLRAGIAGAFGVVSLTNDLTGNSETLAVTQFAGNVLQRQISALVGVNILAGTFNAQLGVMVYVTPAGLSRGFVVGQNCPAPNTAIDNYYVIVTIGGSVPPPTAATQFAGAGDWYICQAEVGTTAVWFLIDYENITVTAANVTLSTVPGLSATNAQTGIEQVQLNAQSRTKDISSTIGLNVTYKAERDAVINLLVANSTDLGGVYVVPNRGLNLGSDGGLSLLAPTGDGLQIGGVKAGANITIALDGTISSDGSGGTASGTVVSPLIPGIESATNVQRALEAIETQVQDRVEFVNAGTEGLTVSVTNPIPTSNDGTTATINLNFSSTVQKGIVQLTNDVTGASETLAPTQLAISLLNSKVDALTGANVLAGTYNSANGTVSTVTPAGRAAGIVPGQQAPAASRVPDNYYLIVIVSGVNGPPGAVIPPTGVQSGDWFISEVENNVAAWITIDYENRAVAAVQVSLAPVTGLTATNVQTGFEQVQLELDKTVNSLTSKNNGITATTFPTPNSTGESVEIQLNPATKFDIGGVFVSDNQGLVLTPSGGLSLAPPTSTEIGGVKAGTGVAIDADGTISVSSSGVSMLPIDSIASQFDGTTTEFVISVPGGYLGFRGKAVSMFIEIGGILQDYAFAYTYSDDSRIRFSSAPPAGATFSGRVLVGIIA